MSRSSLSPSAVPLIHLSRLTMWRKAQDGWDWGERGQEELIIPPCSVPLTPSSTPWPWDQWQGTLGQGTLREMLGMNDALVWELPSSRGRIMNWINSWVEFYTTYFQYTVLATIPQLFWGDLFHLAILASILLNYVGSPPSRQVILGHSILIKDRPEFGFCVCVCCMTLDIVVDFTAIMHCWPSRTYEFEFLF